MIAAARDGVLDIARRPAPTAWRTGMRPCDLPRHGGRACRTTRPESAATTLPRVRCCRIRALRHHAAAASRPRAPRHRRGDLGHRLRRRFRLDRYSGARCAAASRFTARGITDVPGPVFPRPAMAVENEFRRSCRASATTPPCSPTTSPRAAEVPRSDISPTCEPLHMLPCRSRVLLSIERNPGARHDHPFMAALTLNPSRRGRGCGTRGFSAPIGNRWSSTACRLRRSKSASPGPIPKRRSPMPRDHIDRFKARYPGVANVGQDMPRFDIEPALAAVAARADRTARNAAPASWC